MMSRHRTPVESRSAKLHRHIGIRRAFADQAISLANLIGRPVRDAGGTRVGEISDVVVRWDTGVAHPPVVAVVIRAGSALASLEVSTVIMAQTGLRLWQEQQLVSRLATRSGFVQLATDVLDRQLIDITGVQIVRAADVYLIKGPDGWELAGIDVGLRAFARRLLPWTPKLCPPADRVIDWAELHAFVPRFTDTTAAWKSAPTVAAGTAGSGLQLAGSAAALKELRANDLAPLLTVLSRPQQAQVIAAAQPSAAAEALSQLDTDHRDALLAVLDEPDRTRLQRLRESEQR